MVHKYLVKDSAITMVAVIGLDLLVWCINIIKSHFLGCINTIENAKILRKLNCSIATVVAFWWVKRCINTQISFECYCLLSTYSIKRNMTF